MDGRGEAPTAPGCRAGSDLSTFLHRCNWEQNHASDRITLIDLRGLSNQQLLAHLKRLAAAERRCVADMVACMAEIERRQALDGAASPSLFEHCVKELGLTEDSAYRRVRAVRVATRWPEAYSSLREGLVSVTTLAMIEPRLASEPALLKRVIGKNKRDVERIIAEGAGSARRPDSVRVISVPAPPMAQRISGVHDLFLEPARGLMRPGEIGQSSDPELFRQEEPVRETLAEIRLTASETFLASLSRLRALLWHTFPAGRLEDVLFAAITEFIQRHDPARPRREAAAKTPDPRARRPPAAVERAVRLRDGERCAFVAADGRRCGETRGLEVDHVLPWALGGRSDDPANLRLLCPAHNQAEARRLLGPERVGPRRESG